MGDYFAAVGGQVIAWVLPAVLTALAGMATAALARLARKYGYELTEAQAEGLRTFFRDIAAIVEERATRAQKSGVSMSSAEKQAMARRLAGERRPDLTPEAIVDGLDAARPSQLPKLTPSTPATFGR